MREAAALRALRRLGAAQAAVQSQAHARLGTAIVHEDAKRAALTLAEHNLERAVEDWRHCLGARLDPALLGVFAAAAPLREVERQKAREAHAQAQRTTELRRLDYAQARTQTMRQAALARRLGKKLARKSEERALAALEHLITWPGTGA